MNTSTKLEYIKLLRSKDLTNDDMMSSQYQYIKDNKVLWEGSFLCGIIFLWICIRPSQVSV